MELISFPSMKSLNMFMGGKDKFRFGMKLVTSTTVHLRNQIKVVKRGGIVTEGLQKAAK